MKNYLITDPKYYSNDIKKFKIILEKSYIKNKIDFACFRDKESSNFKELAKEFIIISKNHNIKHTFLSTNFLLAKELDFYGVHLNSQQFDDIKESKNLGLKTIISCHTQDDIKLANKNYADFVIYSPIYNTPNKGTPKGIDNLINTIKTFNKTKIIALGGIINKNQIEEIRKSNAFGFASIRYFI